MPDLLEKSNVHEIFELSIVQKGMLFHYLKDANRNFYTVQLSIEIEGAFDVNAFQEAVDIVQNSNEVLRSVFNWEKANKPLQIVLKKNPLSLSFNDISGHSPDAIADWVAKHIRDDRNERFDLTRTALRLDVIKTSPASFILNITHHHILYDGWSTGILLQELFHCYGKLVSKRIPDLKPKPGLRDIVWSLQKKSAATDHITYWQEYLKGHQPVALFVEKDTGVHDVGVEKLSFSLPLSKLEALAGAYKFTKASFVYAAFGILLQKYFNVPEVVFGTVVSSRDAMIQGMDHVIGNFINTIPLRVRDLAGRSFSEIVGELNGELIIRNTFCNTSYFEIKQAVGLKSFENLFDAVVAIENYPLEDGFIVNTGLNMRLRSVYENTGIPLVVTVFFRNGLDIELTYQTDRLDHVLAHTLKDHFTLILNSMIEGFTGKAESLCLLSDAHRKLLGQFNDTAAAYPRKETIVSLFEKQVARTPGAIAVCTDEHVLTYRQLSSLSDNIARYLQTTGNAAEGDLIGLMLERERYLIPCVFGILKAGCAYVPIDPRFPAERINSIIEDSKLKVLITRNAYLSPAIQPPPSILNLSEDLGAIDAQPSGKRKLKVVASSSLAYVIYTSGSTGKPKGVMVEHHAVVNRILWMQKQYPIAETDVILQKTPIVFDVSVWELFWWSFTGASLCLLKPGEEREPQKIISAVEKHNVTTMHFVPSMLSAFLAYLAPDFNFNRLRALRLVFASGEALKKEHVNSFGELIHTHCGSRLINLYGPTEATVDVSHFECSFEDRAGVVPIGKPIDNIRLYVIDRWNQLSPWGAYGELCIAGAGLARGYINNEKLTNDKFTHLASLPKERIYRTGDLVRWLPDGNIEYSDRIDNQVKIRGFRIELGEIETALSAHDEVIEAVAVTREREGDKYLIAYYRSQAEIDEAVLKDHVAMKLPAYMVPSFFVRLEKIPVNSNGKLDRRSLPDPVFSTNVSAAQPMGDVQQKLLKIWSEVLGHDNVGSETSFFDAGGDSLKLINVSVRIRKVFGREVSITDLFNCPTISSLAAFIGATEASASPATAGAPDAIHAGQNLIAGGEHDIAIIGMSGRFPGADNIPDFWKNLSTGEESITRNENTGENRLKVNAKGILKDYDHFDHGFFGYTPKEAENMDPQIRIFHECVYEALENAGYNPRTYAGSIGLYAGASPNPYYNVNVAAEGADESWVEQWERFTYADKDFLCPRISYKLNLKGPSLNITTACSTSLVAIDTACNELRLNKCDVAVAGGISVTLHDNDGYVYYKGMILSPDGRCRAFDEQAAGTVSGNGAGLVVLKKLREAQRDGDMIYAVIKGSATNNDGDHKVGFTAPSIEGQAKVISQAIANAGVPVESISYIETHGTGTALGDPIEIAGLVKAFGSGQKQYCAVGSVKTNIGHLDAAAGVAGLIKTVLSLQHKQLPPSLHFNRSNPNIDFANSPFYVNTEARHWSNGTYPRRAGISSFGIGGTNAHVIVEEAPRLDRAVIPAGAQVITLSAKTERSLRGNITRLLEHLQKQDGVALSDIAYTLQTAREHFKYRSMVVCENREEAIELLAQQLTRESFQASDTEQVCPVVFMFSGQGSQYLRMSRDLYSRDNFFKALIDDCFKIVEAISGDNLKAVIFPEDDVQPADIDNTRFTQPSLFIIEYALAQWLIHQGIRPSLMIGHSIGEYVAACVSGVFSLEDALTLVIKRGQLMQSAPTGAMLGISISHADLLPYIKSAPDVSVAAVNSSGFCVISGTAEAVNSFRQAMEAKGYKNQVIRTSHGFHSHLMDCILEPFRSVVARTTVRPQRIPFISNLTGAVARDHELASPDYWVDHLRFTVRFSDGLETIFKAHPGAVFLEVGPGNALATFARTHKENQNNTVINLLRHPRQQMDDVKYLLKGVGELWQKGVSISWHKFHAGENRRKVFLPPYFFDKTKFSTGKVIRQHAQSREPDTSIHRSAHITDWFYAPGWKSVPLMSIPEAKNCFLILTDSLGICGALGMQLARGNNEVITVYAGNEYDEKPGAHYTLNSSPEHYRKLLGSLADKNIHPTHIVYARTMTDIPVVNGPGDIFATDTSCLQDFTTLMRCAHEMDSLRQVHVTILTNNFYNVLGDESLCANDHALPGILKVIALEFEKTTVRHLDISLADIGRSNFNQVLASELRSTDHGKVVSLRNLRRWEQCFQKISLPTGSPRIRKSGVYLITGGLGKLGFVLAQHLLRKYQAKVILVGRSEVSSQAELIRQLRQEDGECIYIQCDIASRNELSSALQVVTGEFGPFHGVIHAAALPRDRSFDLINKLRPDDYSAHYDVKVKGFFHLYELMHGQSLDFFVACSSISSVLGGVRFGAYVSANTAMDHYSNLVHGKFPLNCISVNLDGISFDDASSEGITSPELVQVFERLTSLTGMPQVIVSVADLDARLNRWVYKTSAEVSPRQASAGQEIVLNNTRTPDTREGIEHQILSLWREYFGIDDIKATDDFFELGGDSLKALTMAGRIQKTFKVELSVADFFNCSTVKQLGSYIRGFQQLSKRRQESTTEASSIIPVAEVRAYYPLSATQQGLYFLNAFETNSIAYNMPLVLRISGQLDEEKLLDAFRRLIHRHENLRTAFEVRDDLPYQRIQQDFDFDFERYVSAGDERQIIENFIRPFDLEKAPLLRAGLIRVGKDEHILMVDLHHIITDGISKSVLISDFTALYRGEVLPGLPLQFKDYVMWLQSPGQRKAITQQERFWLATFAEEYSVLELPMDFPRPPLKTHACGHVRFEIGQDDKRRLSEIAGSQGATLFMLILSAYNVLLSKLSNQEDIVVGNPVAGRKHPDLQQLIGLFVNILPLRNFPHADLTFAEFLTRVRSSVLQYFDNQDYPYETLIDKLKVERNPSRNPLFDTVLFYQNYQQATLEIPGLRVEPYDGDFTTIDYDINLVVFEHDDRMLLRFEYATALFREETVARFVQYFKNIIAAVIQHPHVRLSDIEIVTPDEKDLLINTFNDTRSTIDVQRSFPGIFAQQVAQTPLRVAVEHNGERLTYQQLYDRSLALASYLRSCGIGEHATVALYLPRSIDLLTGIIATFMTGAAYIPLDTAYPNDRIREILSDCGTATVLTRKALSDVIRDISSSLPIVKHIIAVDGYEPHAVNETLRQYDPGSELLAYIIYTSGTTGRPKGVMIRNIGMVNHLYAKVCDLGMDERDIVAQTASPCFDISVWQFLSALAVGGKTFIIDPEVVVRPDKLIRTLEEGHVTVFESVPSLITTFLDELPEGSGARLTSLRWMVPTGEPISVALAKKWYHHFPAVRLMNAYGPTEASDDVTHHVIGYPEEGETIIPIGKPVQNTNIFILDRHLKLCPPGVTGEICIAGLGVGAGYWNDPKKTDAAFVPNPFVGEGHHPDYKMLYRTGDAGYFLQNGNIICKGRLDEQVKIRGNRVELKEVENRLSESRMLREVVVVLRTEKGAQHLVAYYVSDHEISSAQFKHQLSATLPDYMVPSYYVRLERMPLTSNGKLNKKALPAPQIESAHILPVTTDEKLLAGIWSGVLGVEHIGVTDNFFSVGGDSIRSIQISSRLRIAGYELSVRDIFTAQTIREQAARLRPVALLSAQHTITGSAPLTPIQQLYFKDHDIDLHHYNQSVLLNFPETITGAILHRIFKKLQDHHDALRIVFRKESNELVQVSEGLDLPLAMREVDLRNVEDPAEKFRSIANETQAGIELEKGPLMKIALIHLNDGSRVLIVVHHLVMDAVSWRILFEDIRALCELAFNNQPLVLPAKTEPFLSWPEHLSRYVTGKTFQKAQSYWRADSVKKCSPIVRDYPEGIHKVGDSKTANFALDRRGTERLLTDVHKSFRTQINDILLAALLLAVKKSYGQSSMRLDMEGHGRENIAEGISVARTIGWFTSIYSVVLESEESALEELIVNVKETLRRIPNNGIDYLLYKSMPPEDGAQPTAAPAQVIFNYLGQFDSDISGGSYTLAGEPKGDEMSPNKIRVYDWEVWGLVTGGKLSMNLTYSNAQYEDKTIARLMDFYKESLIEIVDFCSAGERARLTPSDLSYKQLSVTQLNELQRRFDLEDVYTLSPMQEGMLFHSLLEPASGNYFEQMTYQIHGMLDRDIVEKSINDLVARHAVLRTLFLHDGYLRPLQVVLRERKVQFIYKDIRHECSPERPWQMVFEAYRLQDQTVNFDLTEDILIRVTMLQVADDEFCFIWSHHHILMDGWCVGILIKEFRDVYSANRNGRENVVTPVSKYVRYIEWLENRDKDLAAEFWRNYLAGYTTLSSFPRKSIALTGGDAHDKALCHLVINSERTRQLHAISRQYGVTLNTILQTAWGILLGKYNDTNDAVFGVVVSGRPAEIEGIEEMIGLFINTIPVRVRSAAEQTVGELLKHVQNMALEAEAHQYHPLVEIQNQSPLKRNLLDHLLIFLNYPIADEIEKRSREDYASGGYEITDVKMYEQTNYDLLLLVLPGEEIRIKFEYNTHAFDSKIMEALSVHLDHLLDVFIADAGIRIPDIDILIPEEHQEMITGINDTRVAYPHDRSVIEFFERQANAFPESVALSIEDKGISYAQLRDAADQIAWYLMQSAAVRPGSLVGILLERDAFLVPSILGVLKAGAAYVPIDPAYPDYRINALIENAELKVLITRDGFRNRSINMSGTVIDIENILADMKPVPQEHAFPKTGGDDLAYVIYTSGSTGMPKGVMITHRSLLNYVSWASRQYVTGEKAAFPLYTSIAFDLTITSIFVPLITGGKIVVYKESDESPIEKVIADNQVNIIKLTPSHLKALLGSDLFHPSVAGNLKALIVGGEDLEYETANAVYQRFNGDITIFNEYGPTEATVGCMIYEFVPGQNYASVPIGWPIDNARIYILDRSLKPVPKGVNGELYISGDGVALGYLSNEVLTAQRFIADPFAAGEKMYRTGDLACMTPHGDILFKGRIDDQVKIRGFRIELAEIEKNLADHGRINATAVLAVEKEGTKHLVAYYIADHDIEAHELKSFLNGRLPEYMVPAHFIRLEQFPLTINGKLNKDAFPELKLEADGLFVPPRTAEEKILAEIWSAVLSAANPGVNDNFFSLGGDSIKSIQICSRLRSAGYNLAVKDIFNHQTIARMAALLAKPGHHLTGKEKALFTTDDESAARTPLTFTFKGLPLYQVEALQQQHDIEDIYTLSPMQEGMLFHAVLDSDAAVYAGQTTFRLKGALSMEAVEKTMNVLIARHPVLRTAFFHKDYERPIQVVLRERKIDLFYEDIRRECTHGVNVTLIDAHRENARCRPFDLSSDALMRLAVLRTADAEFEFIWSHHHVLMDGWCMGILVNEFMTIYADVKKGRDIKLSPPPPYSAYIKWLEARSKEASALHWKNYLDAYENLATLPGSVPSSPDGSGYVQKTMRFTIDESISSALNRISRRYGVTINTIFQCAWAVLLSRYNNVNDVVFGSVVSGRPAEIPNVEDMVGLFINTLPVRIRYNEADRFSGLLLAVQREAFECMEHHYHPLSEIQTASALGQNLLDHIITFENLPMATQVEGNASAANGSGDHLEICDARYSVQTNYDFNITVAPLRELDIRFDYNSRRYDEATIERVANHLRNVIRSIAAQPDVEIRNLSLFSAQERADQMALFTCSLKDSSLITVQQKLRASFRKNASNAAIEHGGKVYTYGDIEAHAQKVAGIISRHKIPEGSCIGILCDDRQWLISAMLGVINSPNVFVPLETTLPRNRLQAMIDQLNCTCIITDQNIAQFEYLQNEGQNICWLTINEIDKAEAVAFGCTTHTLEDTIYVYFTSGSTGNPKGVLGKNKSLAHFIEWEISTFEIKAGFRFSQFTNPGFDAFLRDVFVPLCSGSTICIPPAHVLSSGENIAHWLATESISLVHCVPSFFKLIRKSGPDAQSFMDLKYILLAGEKINPDELVDWFAVFGNRIQLVNLYGATETTLIKGYYLIPSDITRRTFVPVKAMKGAQFLILDKNMNVCPSGGIGEVYIRTPYRTLGYFNAEAANRSNFVASPFNDDRDDILYKTGDLGREHENGEIEILGRSDHQVKIRGIRIELDDIRQNILRYAGVKDTVVVSRKDAENEDFICAYIVPDGPFDQRGLREFLAKVLPASMIPSYLTQIQEIPLLPNGKLNRKALPDPVLPAGDVYVAPANEVERRLQDIWSEVLNIDKTLISVDKSFFELGGHSLKLLLLINKMNKNYNVSIALRDVFDKKDIRNLADYLITVKQIKCEADNGEIIEVAI